MFNFMRWDKDEEEVMNDLWNAGHSAAEIARRLDRTRNQIIGKRNRMIAAGEWRGDADIGRDRKKND